MFRPLVSHTQNTILIVLVLVIVWLCKSRNKLFLFLLSGSIKTSLMSGSSFNITWHLAYPHRVSTRAEITTLKTNIIYNNNNNNINNTDYCNRCMPTVWAKHVFFGLCNPCAKTTILLIVANTFFVSHDPLLCPVCGVRIMYSVSIRMISDTLLLISSLYKGGWDTVKVCQTKASK